MKRFFKQLGQGMTEYIIIVALIAIAAIGVYTIFGDVVRNQVGGMAQELAGTDGSGTAGQAGTSAANTAAEAGTKSLADFASGGN
ncbi:MAG: pilus assembly protein [Gammaproteobacteria bacterium]|nr:pilus assembly protein [Gammaproteobacteria bacterium]